MAENPDRLLVVAPCRVGDLLLAQSLFIELKNRYPACRIDVLAVPDLFPLLERMPQIAKVIPLPAEFDGFGMADRLAFARRIHSFGYSRAILLTDGWRFALTALLARIPVRTGFSPKALLNDIRTVDPQWTTVEKFVALGIGVSEDPVSHPALPNLDIGLHHQIPVIEKFAVTESTEAVLALCPGGGSDVADRWAPECYARLAKAASALGWQIWLLGDENDRRIGIGISETAGRCHNFIGQTTLGEAIDLLSLADVVVTNYSGLMHIALALQRQVLILAEPDRIDSPACRQPGALLLPLSADTEQILSELPGG